MQPTVEETIEPKENKFKAFITNPKTKQILGLIAQVALAATVTYVVGAGLKAAQDAIEAKIQSNNELYNNEIPTEVTIN